MPSFRGFGKSAAEGISAAAIAGLERKADGRLYAEAMTVS